MTWASKTKRNHPRTRSLIADVLVAEDLAIANLMRLVRGKGRRRKAKLSEAIIDAGWGGLLRQLRYKCD